MGVGGGLLDGEGEFGFGISGAAGGEESLAAFEGRLRGREAGGEEEREGEPCHGPIL